MSSKKHKRYKLLLDEGLHFPESYPNLKNLHNLLHIAQTENRGKADDVIFRIAQKEKRILVVLTSAKSTYLKISGLSNNLDR